MKPRARVFFLAFSLIFATTISLPAEAASDDPSLARLLNAVNDAGGTLTSAGVEKLLKDANVLLAPQTGVSRSRQLWCDNGCNLILEDQAGHKLQIDLDKPGEVTVLASPKPPASAPPPAASTPPAPAAPSTPAAAPPAPPTAAAPAAPSQAPPPDGLDSAPPLLDPSDSVSEGPPPPLETETQDQQQPEADQVDEPNAEEPSAEEQSEPQAEDQQSDADQMEAGDEQQPEMEPEEQAESSPDEADEDVSRSSRSYRSHSSQIAKSSQNNTGSFAIRVVTPEGEAKLVDAKGTTLFEGSLSKRNGLTVFSGKDKTGRALLLTEHGTGISASYGQATVFDPMGSFKLETDKNGDLIIHDDQGRTYTGKKNGTGQMVITDPESNSVTILDDSTFRMTDSTGQTILEGNLNKIYELAVAHYADAFPHRMAAKLANP